MIKKILVFGLCALLITMSVNAKIVKSSDFDNGNVFNKGWSEERNGVKILHLNGSFYDMGYQLGFFLKYEILRNLRGFGLSDLNEPSELWSIQKNYIPQEIADYIQGTADAVGVSFDDVGCMWIWEHNCSLHCSSFIADGPATKSNEIIHVYSLDFPENPKDPVTGLSVLNEPVLIIGQPDDGYAFMYPSFAGYVVESGMNEKGISISNTASPCEDENDHGSPIGVRLLQALYTSSTLEEVIDVVNRNRTYGYDILISDVNKNKGYVLEQTANHTCLCVWNDSCESTRPFYQIDHVIRRTNLFVNPETAATQRDFYNPRDIRNYRHFHFGDLYTFIHYKAISKASEKFIKEIDLSNALSSIREVYLNKNGGLAWFILQKTVQRNTIAWYQWSYSPKTGDMLICYADQYNTASENPVYHFNLNQLILEKPSL